jgi:predicted phosphodiesterase
VPGPLTRILSDIHYGDRASRVRQLPQLRPLLEGVSELVLNGDTLDTRPGPDPQHTADSRAAVFDFFPAHANRTTFLTGNHDADLSADHRLDLAAGKVFVVHGDVVFDDIVPWSKDAPLVRRLIAEHLRRLPAESHHPLDQRLRILREVAISIPQRHQSEKNPLKFIAGYLADTAWPPWWFLRVLRAWRKAPVLAATLTRRHRPDARFVVFGHTHRPGIWRQPDGLTVINTGSFCPPFGGYTVDVEAERLVVRRVQRKAGEFRLGATVAEFPLAR